MLDVPTTIPCDREQISPVLTPFFNHNLHKMGAAASTDASYDLSEYRMLLAHQHIILRNLQCLEDMPKLETWTKFAEAFRLELNKPLQKTKGVFGWSPLFWAVLSNNVDVVKYLIKQKANVNEKAKVKKGGFSYYKNFAPLHLNMAVGHGDAGTPTDKITETKCYAKLFHAKCLYISILRGIISRSILFLNAGKEILYCLVDAGANPYSYCKKSKTLRIRYLDPVGSAGLFGNDEMMLNYCSKVTPRFQNRFDAWGTATDISATGSGLYDVVCRYNELGATFDSKSWFGLGAIRAFIQSPREYQRTVDTR